MKQNTFRVEWDGGQDSAVVVVFEGQLTETGRDSSNRGGRCGRDGNRGRDRGRRGRGRRGGGLGWGLCWRRLLVRLDRGLSWYNLSSSRITESQANLLLLRSLGGWLGISLRCLGGWLGVSLRCLGGWLGVTLRCLAGVNNNQCIYNIENLLLGLAISLRGLGGWRLFSVNGTICESIKYDSPAEERRSPEVARERVMSQQLSAERQSRTWPYPG